MKKEFEKRVYSSLIIIPISLFFVIQGSVFFVFFLSLFLIAASLEWLKMSKKNLQLKFLGSFFFIFFILFNFLHKRKFRIRFFYFDSSNLYIYRYWRICIW